MKQQRDFKGIWLPKEIWMEDRLTYLDKTILMEIDSLDNDNQGCYASNEYLANFCGCSESKVSKSISKLKELKYISVYNFDGRKRRIKSNLYFGIKEEEEQDLLGRLVKNTRQTSTNRTRQTSTKRTRQTSKIYYADSYFLLHNNIDNNIDNNNKETISKDIVKKSKEFKPPSLEEVEEYIKAKGMNIDAKTFVDYFEANNWKDSKGNKVKSWKQKLITWNSYGNKKKKSYLEQLEEELKNEQSGM